MKYSLSLALVDFLPVLFTAFGFLYIIRLISFVLPAQGRIAFLGGFLVVAGGFSRALWKLMMVLSGSEVNINWLENSLFVLMAPGYLLLGWSIWQTMRSVRGKTVFSTLIPPFGIIVVMFLASYYFYRSNPSTPAWERILLSVMVLATLFTGIMLITLAFRLKLSWAGTLFVVNLLGVFVMNGLARLPEQAIHVHWMAEGINSFIWLAFAMGAWGLYQRVRSNFPVNNPDLSELSTIPETK